MILVTGASGHLGTPLVQTLIKQGEEVRVLVRDKEVQIKGVEVVKGDILDVETVKRAVDKVDVIYHLAALVNYGTVSDDAMYNVNVNGTKNILDVSKAKKFIYQSSTAVYGDKPKESPIKETTPYNPSNQYGTTKMKAEKLVLEKGGIVLRCPVIYGHGFGTGFDYVLSQIEKGKMRIIGDGNNRIQWVHVDDLIQGLILAKDKGKQGEVYLIDGKDVKTQKELFTLLSKQLNVSPPEKSVSEFLANSLAYYKMITAKMKGKSTSMTPANIARITSDRVFDISKAERELGFSPKVDYEQGAKEMVQDYLSKKVTKSLS